MLPRQCSRKQNKTGGAPHQEEEAQRWVHKEPHIRRMGPQGTLLGRMGPQGTSLGRMGPQGIHSDKGWILLPAAWSPHLCDIAYRFYTDITTVVDDATMCMVSSTIVVISSREYQQPLWQHQFLSHTRQYLAHTALHMAGQLLLRTNCHSLPLLPLLLTRPSLTQTSHSLTHPPAI